MGFVSIATFELLWGGSVACWEVFTDLKISILKTANTVK
jgi:hypothetical protein